MNYILYGQQYPIIKKRLKKLLKERLGEPDDFNVAKFDMDDCEIDEAILDAEMLPLGYDRKAVIFDNVTFLSKGADKELVQKIANLVSLSNDSIDIFLVARTETIDDKSPIVNAVKNTGEIFQFVNLKKEDWPVYVKKYFKDRDAQIDNNAIEELIVRVNGDLNRFINEADKLILYKNHITLMDITLMVAKPIEDDAFAISNALFKGDNALAISIYRDLKLLGSKATDSVLPLLAGQFRFYSEVFYLYQKGLDYNEIVTELGANPYRVKIALQNRKFLSRSDIAHALDDLYYLDYQIKSGQIDRSYGFELFLVNFPN